MVANDVDFGMVLLRLLEMVTVAVAVAVAVVFAVAV